MSAASDISSQARYVTPESHSIAPLDDENSPSSQHIQASGSPKSLSELLEHGSRTPVTSQYLSTKEAERQVNYEAATMIRDCWFRHRNRQMFTLIKHAVCAAEKSLSAEVLRKVSPKEAHLLSDRATQFRVRFRLGGNEFPPQIFFKIFLHTNSSVTYVYGKKMIRPHSEAAEDSLRLMGNRKYFEHMLQDHMHHSEHGVTDLVDVSTFKDYMQYCATLDETPSHLGGRDNCWRKLTLQDLPRFCAFRDIIEFLDNRRSLTYILHEYPELLMKPTTQDILMQHINIVSNIRQPSFKPRPLTTRSYLSFGDQSQSSRRSNRTRERSEKMRNAYISQLGGQEPVGEVTRYTREGTHDARETTQDGDDDEWEEEAGRLYQWSQRLAYEDLSTPQVLV